MAEKSETDLKNEIDNLNKEINKEHKPIEHLKADNSTKKEELDALLEKLDTVQDELEFRKKEKNRFMDEQSRVKKEQDTCRDTEGGITSDDMNMDLYLEKTIKERLCNMIYERLDEFEANEVDQYNRRQVMKSDASHKSFVNAVLVTLRITNRVHENYSFKNGPGSLLKHTFKVSKYTKVESLKKQACDLWGLNSSEFDLYQDRTKDI